MDWAKVFLGGLASGPAPRAEYQHQGQIQGLINDGLGGRSNMQAPQLNAAPQDQFRQGQMQQVGQLQGIASGQQKGAGELAAERQTQNALAGQFAGARMARGGNAALANLGAASNAAGIGLAGSGQAQQSALQDQMNAQGMLAQALGQGRGQDLSMAGQNAQLSQQGQQMNNQMYMQLLQQLTGMDANLLQAKFNAYNTEKAQPGLLGPLLSAGGQVLAAKVGQPGG